MYCKVCLSIGKKYELSYEKLNNNLWMAKCTNPNHYRAFYVSYQYRDGGWFLLPQKMKKPKKMSQTIGDTVHFWDGNKEVKMKKSYLEHIRSRAITPDGNILTGKKGLAYNRARGGSGYTTDRVVG